MKKNIVIAGGGFAGISVLHRLHKKAASIRKDFEIILIDNKRYFEFLPMLPDVISGWLRPEAIRVDLEKIAAGLGCGFVKGRIEEINQSGRSVKLSNTDIGYEYLVISTGSETNFFDNAETEKSCLKLDNVEDALNIRDRLLKTAAGGKPVNVVVIGGGYTGIEVITNVLLLLKTRKAEHKLFLVEKASEILAMVPAWIRKEAEVELKMLGIEVICADSLKNYANKTVTLESGRQITDAVCIWTAGVKTGGFIEKMNAEKVRTRIRVDSTLAIHGSADRNVFAAGDAASFVDPARDIPLRMAVMFSIGQGKITAENILNGIKARSFTKYNPEDLGYLIPMAHGKAPGVVLGKNVHGAGGYFLHYLMCAYRSYKLNKFRVLRDVLFRSLVPTKWKHQVGTRDHFAG